MSGKTRCAERRSCPGSAFIADFTKEIVAPSHILFSFDAFGGAAVNHPKHPTSLIATSHDNLHGISGRAKNGADLRDVTQSGQDVDGVSILQDQHKGVSGAQGLGVAESGRAQGLVIAFTASQTRA